MSEWIRQISLIASSRACQPIGSEICIECKTVEAGRQTALPVFQLPVTFIFTHFVWPVPYQSNEVNNMHTSCTMTYGVRRVA